MNTSLDDFMSGAELISTERQRQKTQEGWSPEHDDQWKNKELAKAALVYLAYYTSKAIWLTITSHWPWSEKTWKPKNSIRNLVRAGALIAAEIDRYKRLEEKYIMKVK